MAQTDGKLTLALVGDIYLTRSNPASIFEPTLPALRAADVRFGNCETPISESGEPWPGKPIGNNCIKMAPEMVAGLKAAGFDAVGLASNHSLDFGAGAMLRTLEILDEAGIARCGAGKNLAEAHRPAVVTKNGVTIAFLAYCSVYMPGWEATENGPGIASIRVETAYKPHPRIHEQPGAPAITLNYPDQKDRARMVADIRAAKEQADLVVVSYHWGVSERYRHLVPYQVELGHAAVDAGADLLIGHHPHMLQGVEMYKGKPLFYSLGNFAFDLQHPWFKPESVIVKCYVENKRISRVAVVPCLIDQQNVPQPLHPEAARAVTGLLEEDSAAFGTRFVAEGDEVVIS